MKHSYPDRYSMKYCDVIVLKIFGFIRPQDYAKISVPPWSEFFFKVSKVEDSVTVYICHTCNTRVDERLQSVKL